jgi:hypothetical protein
MENDKTAQTIPGANPVTGTIKNPAKKPADSIPHAQREAAKLHEERDKLSERPGPADTSARTTVVKD